MNTYGIIEALNQLSDEDLEKLITAAEVELKERYYKDADLEAEQAEYYHKAETALVFYNEI
jgi:hypothetical protein